MLAEPIIEEREDEEINLLHEKSYRVVFFNDDEIPVEPVMIILKDIFGLEMDEIIKKIILAEKEGKAVARGGYTFSKASEKINESKKMFEKMWAGKQLKLTIEEE